MVKQVPRLLSPAEKLQLAVDLVEERQNDPHAEAARLGRIESLRQSWTTIRNCQRVTAAGVRAEAHDNLAACSIWRHSSPVR